MKTSNAWIVFYIAVMIAGAAVVAFGTGWQALRFTYVSGAEIAAKFATLVLFSLIIERTLEVFLSVWRARDSELFDAQVGELKKLEESEKDPTKKAEINSRLQMKQQEQVNFKAKTMAYAMPLGLFLGIVVAAFGVRVLSQFLEIVPKDGVTPRQLCCFAWIDIVFTGALLGGGSDPIHRLMNLYRKLVDKTTDNASAPRPAKSAAQP